MNDAMKFIYRITSGGANHGVIESFSGRNSYWFASILFRRFIRNNAAIMYDPKNNCFGTRIGGKVYDVTGDVTENHKWISWVEYSNNKSKDQVTKEDIMF